MTATFGLLPVNAGGILTIDCNANNGNKTMAKTKAPKETRPVGEYDYALRTLRKQIKKLEGDRDKMAFTQRANTDKYTRVQTRLGVLRAAVELLTVNNFPPVAKPMSKHFDEVEAAATAAMTENAS